MTFLSGITIRPESKRIIIKILTMIIIITIVTAIIMVIN